MISAKSTDMIRIEVFGEGRAVVCLGSMWLRYREERWQMLDALRNLLAAFVQEANQGDGVHEDHMPAFGAAQAVIAKAEAT